MVKILEHNLFLKFGLTGTLCGLVLALSLSRTFYDGSMSSAFLAMALASAIIVLVVIRRSWLDLLWVLAGGAFLAGLDFWGMNFHRLFIAGFSFAGLAALGVLGTLTIWAQGEERKQLLYGFLPAVLFVGSEYMATTLLDITEKLHPKTFDLFLYSFDCSLRVQLSFLMGQLFWKWQMLRFVCLVVYIALPLPLALVYAAQLHRKKENALTVMLAFLVTGPIGVLFYNMLPACGPVHVFASVFPLHPPDIAFVMGLTPVPILLKGARNAIPSLHMAWVLLVWWNSKGLAGWIRAISLTFVILTAMATLGTGEHYFVDLVVAFPFSLMVQALCSYSLSFREGPRRNAFLGGTFVTLCWLALLSFSPRIFWISPLLPWAMAIATVAGSIHLWNRLTSSEPQTVPAHAHAAAASVSV